MSCNKSRVNCLFAHAHTPIDEDPLSLCPVWCGAMLRWWIMPMIESHGSRHNQINSPMIMQHCSGSAHATPCPRVTPNPCLDWGLYSLGVDRPIIRKTAISRPVSPTDDAVLFVLCCAIKCSTLQHLQSSFCSTIKEVTRSVEGGVEQGCPVNYMVLSVYPAFVGPK